MIITPKQRYFIYRRNIAFLSIFLSTDILIASVRRSRAYFDLLLCPNILLDIA